MMGSGREKEGREERTYLEEEEEGCFEAVPRAVVKRGLPFDGRGGEGGEEVGREGGQGRGRGREGGRPAFGPGEERSDWWCHFCCSYISLLLLLLFHPFLPPALLLLLFLGLRSEGGREGGKAVFN
jgi:hypothetical protein